MSITPTVVDSSAEGDRAFDIDSLLLEERIAGGADDAAALQGGAAG
jgi:hypothetical protein